MSLNNTDWLKDKGYVKGTYESLLSQFGISPNKSKTGNNVNQKEYTGYLSDYAKSLEADPASVMPSYGRMQTGFEEAKKYFSDMLPSLQPRYQNLLNQIAGEQQVAQEKNVQQSGKEATMLKSELAKRGLSTASSDTYAAGEFNKLGDLQNTRTKETDLQFSKERLITEESRTAEEERLNTALSSLTVDQTKTLSDILNTEKNRITAAAEGGAAATQNMASMQIQIEQWDKNFQFMKDKDAADRALELFKATTAKGEAAKKDKTYATELLSLVNNAYTSKSNVPYTRELIEEKMKSEFPSMTETIKSDISKYFPNGWETSKTSGGGVATEVQSVMDALGVDEETAKLLIRQEAGL